MQLGELTQLSEHEWEIPRTYRRDMLVPVRLFATAADLQHILADKSLEQAVNATTLPGVVGAVVVMPDAHQGYGFPIGGVAATLYPHGVISPGAIGYDINCGVRLLASNVTLDQARPLLRSLADRLHACCPTGVGGLGAIKVSNRDLNQVLSEGSAWARKAGFATESDVERTEDGGQVYGGDPDCVSARAKERGRPQLGSLGAGNHFLEVDVIEELHDGHLAGTFGLQPGCLVIQIHCGSRGLGHQVCTDYVQQFQSVAHNHGIHLPDRELVCAPLDSREGRAYLGAMRAAANFAFVNRQILAHFVRRAFDDAVAATTGGHLIQVYDVAHNMGKLEDHEIGGRPARVCVHRKGATRALGPGAVGLPAHFARSGQPVLVPGSMGTASWVLAAASGAAARSLGSCCHGAGRLWSRSRARKEIRGDQLRGTLEQQGILIRAGSLPGLAEEAPSAYKDVDAVVETVVAAGIAVKVARLRPLVVIKG